MFIIFSRSFLLGPCGQDPRLGIYGLITSVIINGRDLSFPWLECARSG